MPDSAVEATIPALSKRIRQLMSQQGVPGVSIGIVHGPELKWSGGFGYADLASGRPMDANTSVGVASITKTLTATAIVQLRDLGKLKLDDPVVRHIPEFKAVRNRFGSADDVTIRGLLTHRSGLVGESPTGHWTNLKFPSMTEVLELLPRVEVVIEPASAFKYCNLAFALLGEIVTRATGRPYAEYISTEILTPLGMSSSRFAVDDEIRGRTATGYLSNRYEDVPAVSPDPPTNGYAAAAGLRSSVTDLAKWLSLQFRTEKSERSGSQILAGRSLGEMHRVSYVESDWVTGYALTWLGTRIRENVYLQHGGSVPGFLSMVAFNQRHRIGVVVLTNKQGHAAAGTIAFEALEMVVAEEARAGPEAVGSPVTTPDKFKGLIGRYVASELWGAILHVEYRNGKLALVAPADPYAPPPPPPAPLKETGQPNEFVVGAGRPAGESIVFQRSDGGAVTGFVLGEDGSFFRKTD
jgi:D-alanyl-D-alanine carboxypeptidase